MKTFFVLFTSLCLALTLTHCWSLVFTFCILFCEAHCIAYMHTHCNASHFIYFYILSFAWLSTKRIGECVFMHRHKCSTLWTYNEFCWLVWSPFFRFFLHSLLHDSCSSRVVYPVLMHTRSIKEVIHTCLLNQLNYISSKERERAWFKARASILLFLLKKTNSNDSTIWFRINTECTAYISKMLFLLVDCKFSIFPWSTLRKLWG